MHLEQEILSHLPIPGMAASHEDPVGPQLRDRDETVITSSLQPFSWPKNELVKILRLIAERQDDRLDLEIEEMFGGACDDELTGALRPEVSAQSADHRLIRKRQLLRYALACAWPRSDLALLREWDSVLRILNDAGTFDIVQNAIQRDWAPEQFTQADFEKWMKKMQGSEG
jgi:hypothetical protein